MNNLPGSYMNTMICYYAFSLSHRVLSFIHHCLMVFVIMRLKFSYQGFPVFSKEMNCFQIYKLGFLSLPYTCLAMLAPGIQGTQQNVFHGIPTWVDLRKVTPPPPCEGYRHRSGLRQWVCVTQVGRSVHHPHGGAYQTVIQITI